MKNFNMISFLLRFLASAVIVLLTFNPSGYSYYHWLSESINGASSTFGAEHAFAGVLLIIGWTILIRSTLRSLGALGLVLASLLIGTFVWLLTSNGFFEADSTVSIAWIALMCLSVLLAIGMSWSHVRRRLSGQVDVDDLSD